MTGPITLRLPEDLLEAVDALANGQQIERAALLRDLIREGLQAYQERVVLADFQAARLSYTEAAAQLGLDVYEFHDFLRRAGAELNVGLEEWVASRPAL